jgi:hypothetical protein
MTPDRPVDSVSIPALLASLALHGARITCEDRRATGEHTRKGKEFLSMVTFLIQLFLGGCRHGPQSRLFTLDDQTYKVCLHCAKVIPYSLERMAPLSSRERRELKIVQAKRSYDRNECEPQEGSSG